MSKNIRWIVNISTVLFTIILILTLCVSSQRGRAANGRKSPHAFFNQDTFRTPSPVYHIPIPEKIDFAGEPVPIHLFDVRESLDRELQTNTYWHSQTVLLLKRANRFFPIIEPILKGRGVPDDFKYLAIAESGLMQVVSPSKAVGFWQILKGTGQELGLEINNEVDERYHIEKSTHAACTFLLESYKRYNDWTLTAASYNCGRTGLQRQINRQGLSNYYDMLHNEETARYVFRIISFKAIFEQPEMYGFYLEPNELYPPLQYDEIKVDSTIENMAEFAFSHNTNYKILKLLNPWLRENYLKNSAKKTYYIKVPKAGFRENAY